MKEIVGCMRLTGFRLLRAMAGVCVITLAGCVGVQVHPASNVRAISLSAGQLEAHGIAFITPTTTTGREEEKQAVAHVFGETFKRERRAVRTVALPETLSAINKADLADPYKRMYDEQRDTGVFQRAMLAHVGRITGTRYIAQIKLQEFTEGAKERFSLFSLRLIETSYARVRVFLQIWDSRDGSIAWEGMQELTYAHERISEEPVTFQKVVDHAALRLVSRLP
jgi:uncharacterized protein (DUF1800 family)